MNNNKSHQIKNIASKIDIEKINGYLQEYPKSETLRQIFGYRKRILDSSNDQEIFRLSVKLAYNLDTIINVSKYVKKEEEKKYWLEISRELFENTIGVKT